MVTMIHGNQHQNVLHRNGLSEEEAEGVAAPCKFEPPFKLFAPGSVDEVGTGEKEVLGAFDVEGREDDTAEADDDEEAEDAEETAAEDEEGTADADVLWVALGVLELETAPGVRLGVALGVAVGVAVGTMLAAGVTVGRTLAVGVGPLFCPRPLPHTDGAPLQA